MATPKEHERGDRIVIAVACIEFNEGGNTLWVQGYGGTVLRIKTDGKITSSACASGPSVSHFDLAVSGDIRICLGQDHAERSALSPATVLRRMGLKPRKLKAAPSGVTG